MPYPSGWVVVVSMELAVKTVRLVEMGWYPDVPMSHQFGKIFYHRPIKYPTQPDQRPSLSQPTDLTRPAATAADFKN
jgi:hypothetical protein